MDEWIDRRTRVSVYHCLDCEVVGCSSLFPFVLLLFCWFLSLFSLLFLFGLSWSGGGHLSEIEFGDETHTPTKRRKSVPERNHNTRGRENREKESINV